MYTTGVIVAYKCVIPIVSAAVTVLVASLIVILTFRPTTHTCVPSVMLLNQLQFDRSTVLPHLTT